MKHLEFELCVFGIILNVFQLWSSGQDDLVWLISMTI